MDLNHSYGMKTVSVVIPTYEMHGKGVEFLDFSLNVLHKQTFKDFDVIVSDHSKSHEILNVCKIWSQMGLDVKYIRNFNNLGSSSHNLNYGMSIAKGKYIKVLFQDDFLFDQESLEKSVLALESNPDRQWLVSPSEHSYDGVNMTSTHIPHYHDEIHLGKNTISSPSVLTLRNEFILEFDNNLIWLMDVEYYKRLYLTYGPPVILDSVTVVNRLWELQLSHIISAERKNAEKEYTKKLYDY